MNEQQTKNALEILSEALAAITARAMDAERERDEAKAEARSWYEYYEQKNEALKEAESKLADEIAKNDITRQTLARQERAETA